MDEWKPGDVANGHVLGEDLVWRPVGEGGAPDVMGTEPRPGPAWFSGWPATGSLSSEDRFLLIAVAVVLAVSAVMYAIDGDYRLAILGGAGAMKFGLDLLGDARRSSAGTLRPLAVLSALIGWTVIIPVAALEAMHEETRSGVALWLAGLLGFTTLAVLDTFPIADRWAIRVFVFLALPTMALAIIGSFAMSLL